MPQPRCASMKPFLCVLACLCVLATVTALLWPTGSCPEHKPQSPQSTHLPMPPAVPLVAKSLPDPPEELREEDVSFPARSVLAEPEQAAAKPAQATGRIASQVIPATALEEPQSDELGPSLMAGMELPPQSSVEQPVSPSVVPAKASPAPRKAPQATATAGHSYKIA